MIQNVHRQFLHKAGHFSAISIACHCTVLGALSVFVCLILFTVLYICNFLQQGCLSSWTHQKDIHPQISIENHGLRYGHTDFHLCHVIFSSKQLQWAHGLMRLTEPHYKQDIRQGAI